MRERERRRQRETETEREREREREPTPVLPHAATPFKQTPPISTCIKATAQKSNLTNVVKLLPVQLRGCSVLETHKGLKERT